MEIIIETSKEKFNAIHTKLERMKDVKINVSDKSQNSIIVYHSDVNVDNLKAIQKIKKKFYEIKGILTVTVAAFKPTSILITPVPRNKSLYFFLDIDKTITDKDTKYVNTKAYAVFRKMEKLSHKIIFTSGRSFGELYEMIRDSNTISRIAIAENGGVIVNGRLDGDIILGDKNVCEDAYYNRLKPKYPKLHEEGKMRKSEVVVNRAYGIQKLQKCLGKNSEVRIYDSGDWYHIDSKDVHKGKAVYEIKNTILKIPDDRVISMGDSELDIPMFKASKFSIAVGNADPKVKSYATICVKGTYMDGVLEGFRLFENKI